MLPTLSSLVRSPLLPSFCPSSKQNLTLQGEDDFSADTVVIFPPLPRSDERQELGKERPLGESVILEKPTSKADNVRSPPPNSIPFVLEADENREGDRVYGKS